MPYAPVRVPSLALGIIQAVLQRDGFSAASLYANILFSSEIGVRDYSRLWMILRSENAIAEWTFAHIAFPAHSHDPGQFIKLLDERNSNFLDLQDPVGRLMRVRDIASRFVDDLVDRILMLKPRILGCTSTFFQHVSSLALLRKIKEKNQEIVTMMGGANCESVMGMTTHKVFDWVDYVVSGEAEELISTLTRGILQHGNDMPSDLIPYGVFAPIHRVDGYPLDHGSDSGKYPRATVKDLNQQPVPDYDDYMKTFHQTPAVRSEIKMGLLSEGSRGCWWQKKDGCTFCGLNGSGKKFRKKKVEVILDELNVLKSRYGVNRFEMVDNVFDPGFMTTLIPELIEIGSPYDIFFEIRAGLDRSDFEKLREAGVMWIQPGIETLHTGILEVMNKGTQAWQNIQILKWCSQFGIRCSWILMHGLPDEQDSWYEEMADYLPSLFHLQAPRSLTRVRYVRFSQYHSKPEKFGLKLSPARPFSLVYPIPESDLSDLVYYFDEEEQMRRQLAPPLAECFLNPGFLKVKKIQHDWVKLQDNDSYPELTMQLRGEKLFLLDSRPIAERPEYFLEQLSKDIYLFCDSAPKEEALIETFSERGNKLEDVRAILDFHLRKRLTLCLDGRYISLALRRPVTPLRPFEDFPGGYLTSKTST